MRSIAKQLQLAITNNDALKRFVNHYRLLDPPTDETELIAYLEEGIFEAILDEIRVSERNWAYNYE